jgi:AraC-like DNA-binding protein
MHTLYDTRTVHPLDRYEYYRAAAASELVPVSIHGRPPSQLLAMMSGVKIGDFTLEVVTWAADGEAVRQRNERLIRAGDPESYRIFLSATPGVRIEQADHQVELHARDVALYDLSRPSKTTHPTTPTQMQVVMLTFPRALVPVAHDTVRPLVGTVMPRSMPGRSLVAQLLIGLTDATTDEQADDPSLADVLYECAVGLIRERLGQPDGITLRTRRLLQMQHIRGIIRRHLANPELDPDRIASAAHISPRYLHTIFQDAEFSPMQLLKRMRLEECRRSLQDPALARTPIKNVIAAHGYRRPDQFARDFKQLYGVSAHQVRRLARQQPSHREG